MPNKKNLLIYAHYYIPDTASTGQILRELAEGMLDKFNITVICVVPSYLGTIELGNTQIINTLVYKECPKIIDYAYGTSYFKMLFSMIPNLWGGVHPSSIDVDSVFSPLYSKTTGLGSSFLAEAYWNFGCLPEKSQRKKKRNWKSGCVAWMLWIGW